MAETKVLELGKTKSPTWVDERVRFQLGGIMERE